MQSENLERSVVGLLKLNARHSQIFMEGQAGRRDHRERHSTEIWVCECMDLRCYVQELTVIVDVNTRLVDEINI